jgi:hypothetical protein
MSSSYRSHVLRFLLSAALASGSSYCGGSTVPEGASDASTSGSRGSSDAASSSDGAGNSSDGGCRSGADCAMGLTCCGGQCVNAYNDPHNCGGCGVTCAGMKSFCEGQCIVPPCSMDAGACGSGTCCGTQCCGQGELCCISGAGEPIPQCYALQNGQTTCPVGCPLCQ